LGRKNRWNNAKNPALFMAKGRFPPFCNNNLTTRKNHENKITAHSAQRTASLRRSSLASALIAAGILSASPEAFAAPPTSTPNNNTLTRCTATTRR